MPIRRKLSRAEMIAEVVAMHARGWARSDMSRRLQVKVALIDEMLREAGLSVDGREPGECDMHPMWSADENRRRFAIWRRQRDGARAARRQRA
jgi:hypothetical protein